MVFYLALIHVALEYQSLSKQHELESSMSSCSLPPFTEYAVSKIQLYFFECREEEEFPEVLDFVTRIEGLFSVPVVRLRNRIKDEIEGLKISRGLTAVLLGVRHGDPYSEELTGFDPSTAGWPQFMRVHPVLDWTYAQVWEFLRTIELDYCPLYDLGFTSLGMVGNTCRNPVLKRTNSRGDEFYLPAYELVEDKYEREGRVSI